MAPPRATVLAATSADAGLVRALTRRARPGLGLEPLFADAVVDAARAAGVRRQQLGVRVDQPRLLAFRNAPGFEPDDAVALSSHNPLTAPPVTMSWRLDPPGEAPR